MTDLGMLYSIASRIADNPGALPLRQDSAYRLIESAPGRHASEPLFALMDAEFAERLRRILLVRTETGMRLNHGALDMLANYGDPDTARQLKEWIELQPNRGELWNRYGVVGAHIWMIEAQQNPPMLLDYLRSAEWIDYSSRLWALSKAVKLGIDKAEIRAAVLQHSTHVNEDDRLRPTMRHLKKLAIQEGALRPDDLPDVELPSEDPGEEFRSAAERARRRSGEQSP